MRKRRRIYRHAFLDDALIVEDGHILHSRLTPLEERFTLYAFEHPYFVAKAEFLRKVWRCSVTPNAIDNVRNRVEKKIGPWFMRRKGAIRALVRL